MIMGNSYSEKAQPPIETRTFWACAELNKRLSCFSLYLVHLENFPNNEKNETVLA